MRLIFIILMFSYLLRRYSFWFYRGKVRKIGDTYKTVIIGDYNIISTPSKLQGNKQHSTDIFDWMKHHNLLSVHHTNLNEGYGKESNPTYYHMYRENSKFFIDYAFTNAEIVDYKLFSRDETKRMSDHVPIMVEVK